MMSSDRPEAKPGTLERVKTIVRRDLKLGPDIAITDDMPFFGTEADVDSLDILLLLTSVEREFGIRIPSEKVGREVFENVGTLVRYIEQHAPAGGAGASATSGVAPSNESYLERLPHREPFRFLSRVTEVKPGESAAGVWSVSGQEPFFAGHFPGRPVVPGVLLAEALAQLAGLAGPLPPTGSPAPEGRLAHVDVRFDESVAPPAEIELRATLTRSVAQLHQFDVVARVGMRTVARGSLALSYGAPAGG